MALRATTGNENGRPKGLFSGQREASVGTAMLGTSPSNLSHDGRVRTLRRCDGFCHGVDEGAHEDAGAGGDGRQPGDVCRTYPPLTKRQNDENPCLGLASDGRVPVSRSGAIGRPQRSSWTRGPHDWHPGDVRDDVGLHLTSPCWIA
jgi:hypothetical protein